MKWHNHYLFSLNILLVAFYNKVNISFLVLSAFFFGCLLPDLDHFFGYIRKSILQYRTWVQEPAGLVAIGLPVAYIASKSNPLFFFVVILAFLGHILLDYLCTHETFPLAPFTYKIKKSRFGFFRYTRENGRGVSESYFFIFNIFLFLVIAAFIV